MGMRAQGKLRFSCIPAVRVDRVRSMASGPKTLRGWKEIATHVGRDVRTVQRWEARRGFPVRRLPGGERGNVYALTSEVDEWLHPANGSPSPAAADADPIEDEIESPVAAVAAAEVSIPPATEAESGIEERPGRRFWPVGVGVVVLLVGLVVVGTVLLRRHQGEAAAAPALAGAPRHYVSPVSGLDAQYLQGMYLFEKRTPSSLMEAKRVLLEVTARDPQHAPAWSGLAQTLTLMAAYGVGADPHGTAEAQAAAGRALQLDSGLAEPHAVMGFADFFWDGDIRNAEPEFRRALEVNPGCALARNWYGTVLTYEGRFPEALEQLTEAQRLQPSSTAILANRALALGLSGHRDEAVHLLQQAGEDDPIASVRFSLAVLSLVQPRDVELHLREELQLAALSHSEETVRFQTAAQEAYRRGGEKAMWRWILARGEREPVSLETMAEAHAALGENDAALETLARALKEGQRPVDLAMNPLLLPLHRDPRFSRLVSAEGLPAVP